MTQVARCHAGCTLAFMVTEHHLVEEDDSIVSGPLLQALPKHEALHFGHHHHFHGGVLLEQASQQVAGFRCHLT